jgi:hypothetical protein
MCVDHFSLYQDVTSKPIRGIEPERTSEDWRGSIADMMRHASIAISFAERDNQAKALASMGDLRRPGDGKYTPAQMAQMMVLRKNLALSSQQRSNP